MRAPLRLDINMRQRLSPIGESVFRKSLGLSLCSGVSTAPGATALKRIYSLADSRAVEEQNSCSRGSHLHLVETFRSQTECSATCEQSLRMTALKPNQSQVAGAEKNRG
jgi:hypothetical protein